jgi:hypothetical protein
MLYGVRVGRSIVLVGYAVAAELACRSSYYEHFLVVRYLFLLKI